MDWYDNTYIPTGQLINAGYHTEPTSNYLSNLRRRDYTVLRDYNSNATTLLRNLNRYHTEYKRPEKEIYNIFSILDGTNIPAYFDSIKETVIWLLYDQRLRYQYRVIKYAISLYVKYLNPEDEPIVIGFQATWKKVLALNQLDLPYNIAIHELETKIHEYEGEGSGYKFVKILSSNLNIDTIHLVEELM